jgi:hypothetical protein
MSASDAAPLPRLGEVFFDVRGSSRSMRLSWYSDTGVAVFSIWQGGTCTGTFRLPIDDLSRMIEALQRGPRGAGLPAADSTGVSDLSGLTSLPGGRGAEVAPAPYAEYSTGQHLTPASGPPASPAPSFTPSPSYRDRDDSPSYREDPLTSPSFRDEARSGRYRQQSPAPSPAPSFTPPASPGPSFTPSPSYRDRDDSPSHREDPLTSPSFRDQGRSDRYRSSSYRDRDQDYQPGDDYPSSWRDGDSGDYPAPGPPRSEGYRGRRYVDDPFQSNYPDEPPGGSRPYSDPDQEPRSHRGRPSRT